jgi:putative copper resistance protein D
VLDAALVALRGVQYATAMVLFGSSLFLIYARPDVDAGPRATWAWLRRLLTSSAAVLLVASVCAFVVQTSILAGSLSEGIKPESLWAVITTTAFGPSALVRAASAALALVALASLGLSPWGRGLAAALGGVATASIGWMGHGPSTEGGLHLLHLASDVLHALAAGVWIGALVVFLGGLRRSPEDPAQVSALHRTLQGFGGVGSVVVAVIVATGLVNSWFLVGLDQLGGLVTTLWGQLLLAKVVLFLAMLGFAAHNRFRLTPGLEKVLEGDPSAALFALRRSITLETIASVAVLALVALLGMQPPPADI